MAAKGNATISEQEKSAGKKVVSNHKFLIHHQGDHVGVATQDIAEGETVTGIYMDDNSEVQVIVKGNVPLGHKIALVDLQTGEPVLKYGIQIGLTTCEWKVGDYVHTHNIKTARW
ncbi:(2R)-sulfolactate sulfo-lyase subunit alpha [Bacillus sp. OV194]|nr:(2R)-sulfolactate sulfo-lyase subunit alpha [Bacillus sp. OV194]